MAIRINVVQMVQSRCNPSVERSRCAEPVSGLTLALACALGSGRSDLDALAWPLFSVNNVGKVFSMAGRPLSTRPEGDFVTWNKALDVQGALRKVRAVISQVHHRDF